jgi:Myb-like DNA-binding protein FlbD
MVSHHRGPWSREEDGALVQFVPTHGSPNWVKISQLMVSRSPKQCHERYYTLKPALVFTSVHNPARDMGAGLESQQLIR